MSYNHQGSLRAVVDSNGTIVKEVQYDAFGNITLDTNSALHVNFGFAGGLYDSDTKLTRFGYRDYDAQTGKWTAKDPIGFNGGDTNLYGYVLNDPVNWVDPEGLNAWDDFGDGMWSITTGLMNFGKFLADITGENGVCSKDEAKRHINQIKYIISHSKTRNALIEALQYYISHNKAFFAGRMTATTLTFLLGVPAGAFAIAGDIMMTTAEANNLANAFVTGATSQNNTSPSCGCGE